MSFVASVAMHDHIQSHVRPPTCENEDERVAELERYAVLDTPKEPEFDAITRLVAHVCQTPIAVINLIGKGRQWFKAEIGLGVRETPLDVSICAHAILQPGLFVVPDLRLDHRFVANPLIVGDPKLRFYAGALLKTPDGFALGTLCVLDTKPRELTPEQADALTTLASHVMNLFESQRNLAVQKAMREQLEATLESRRRLIATVAHDLRSPLSVVKLGASALQMTSENPKVAATVARMERAVDSMTSLVEDLLDFETADSGGVKLEVADVDVTRLLDESADTFSEAARAGEISVRVSGDRGITATADVERIRQVLANLIGNAIKVVPTGGHIDLTAKCNSGSVRISVADSGPGVSDEQAARVFEPFWRGEHVSKGAGLGLAIARRIVEAHGGTMGLARGRATGAEFWFTLPAEVCH